MTQIVSSNGTVTVQACVYLPLEMREAAKEHGVNLSKTLRDALGVVIDKANKN